MIQESEINLYAAEPLADEWQLLGVALFAHLKSLPGLLSASHRELFPPTIHNLGIVFYNSKRTTGYRQAWLGKASSTRLSNSSTTATTHTTR
jgi:hypothetical protein